MRRFVLSGFFCIVTASLTFGQDILISDFSGTSPAENTPWTQTATLAPGVTFSGWMLGAGAQANSGDDDAFSFRIGGPASPESTLAEAIAEDEYIGFTLTPGSVLDLNGRRIAFSIQRESWHAPRQYALLSSVDGFAESAPLFTTGRFDSGDYSVNDSAFFLPPSGYDGLTGPVEFRLYAFAANYDHETRLTDFSITDFSGSVFSITISAATGGTVSANPAGTWFEEGTSVQVSAAPDPGYRFAGWTGDVTGFGNPVTVTLNADTTLTADCRNQIGRAHV